MLNKVDDNIGHNYVNLTLSHTEMIRYLGMT